MFFYASKVLGFFALPSNLVLSIGLLGVILMLTRLRRLAVFLMASSAVLLAVLGVGPIGNALILPLEERFPRWDGQGAPDGIVVLGGSFDTVVAPARNEISLTEAAERVTVVADLARRYPNARIVFSGGSGRLIYQGTTEATLATRLFDSFGIARNRFAVEDRARDTFENAVYSKQIAQPRPGERWLLVTSAAHMPRAIGAFRAAGFAVDPYPVDYRTRGQADLARPFQSAADGLKRVDAAAHEWAGLIAYWISGRTSELMPRPER